MKEANRAKPILSPTPHAEKSQISWNRLFPFPEADSSDTKIKGLNPEETSFIEKYLKLADQLLGAAEAAEQTKKLKKTG